MIPVNQPLLNGREKELLCECIDSGWVSSDGPFLKKFEKMKPADKAKLQDKGSKSYKDLLKGLKEEDTSMLGRIERKLKEIRNG